MTISRLARDCGHEGRAYNPIMLENSSNIHPASAPDYMPAAHMRDLQLNRLRATVTRAYERVELYRRRMNELKVRPEDIRNL